MARADAAGRARDPFARAAALVGCAVLALAVWLLAPAHPPRTARDARPLHLVVLDASASATRRSPGWERWALDTLAREAAAAAAVRADFMAVGYGRDVVRLAGPGAADAARARFEAARDPGELGLSLDARAAAASDLAGALALAAELGRGRSLTSLRLASDRSFTGRDPEPLLRELEARGAPRSWIDPPPATLPDLSLLALELPAEVEAGARLVARARLRLEPGARPPAGVDYVLELELEAPGGTRTWSVRGETPAAAAWPVRLELGPAERGRTQVRARAVLLAGPGRGDALPENDALTGTVRAGAPLTVSVLAGASSRRAAATWARRARTLGGIDARLRELDELAEALASDAVLVTFDVDPRALPAAALSSFVRSGGGWLAFAGPETLAGWDVAPELAALAPLDLHPGGLPPRDVVLLLDGSGSMSGAPLEAARAAARRLAASTPRDERVVLRWFSDHLEPALDALDAVALEARAAVGATDLPGALGELADQRADSGRAALALLVSDGRHQEADDGALAALRARLAAADVELAVFAVGAEADRDFLGRLAGDAGVIPLDDPARLEALFRRETTRRRVGEGGPYEVTFAALAERGGLSASAASAQVLGRDDLPGLDTFVRGRARVDAEVPWTVRGGEPLFALARRGLGHAALFASLPAAVGGELERTWAPSWSVAVDLFDPTLRLLGRARGASTPRLTLANGRLVCEEVPDGWPALLLARAGGAGDAVEPAAVFETLLAPESGAAVDPRAVRAGPWPFDGVPGGRVELRDARDPEAEPLGTLLVARGAAPEFVAFPRRVAAIPAGGTPGERFSPAGAPRGPHPLGGPVLGVALLLIAAASLAWGRR